MKPSERSSPVIVTDLGATWALADWTVSCASCPYRAEGLAYGELPPWFWRLSVSASDVWAWNREHLEFLAACLEGRAITEHPYAWLAAYVPGEWKRRRARIARAIRARLETA